MLDARPAGTDVGKTGSSTRVRMSKLMAMWEEAEAGGDAHLAEVLLREIKEREELLDPVEARALKAASKENPLTRVLTRSGIPVLDWEYDRASGMWFSSFADPETRSSYLSRNPRIAFVATAGGERLTIIPPKSEAPKGARVPRNSKEAMAEAVKYIQERGAPIVKHPQPAPKPVKAFVPRVALGVDSKGKPVEGKAPKPVVVAPTPTPTRVVVAPISATTYAAAADKGKRVMFETLSLEPPRLKSALKAKTTVAPAVVVEVPETAASSAPGKKKRRRPPRSVRQARVPPATAVGPDPTFLVQRESVARAPMEFEVRTTPWERPDLEPLSARFDSLEWASLAARIQAVRSFWEMQDRPLGWRSPTATPPNTPVAVCDAAPLVVTPTVVEPVVEGTPRCQPYPQTVVGTDPGADGDGSDSGDVPALASTTTVVTTITDPFSKLIERIPGFLALSELLRSSGITRVREAGTYNIFRVSGISSHVIGPGESYFPCSAAPGYCSSRPANCADVAVTVTLLDFHAVKSLKFQSVPSADSTLCVFTYNTGSGTAGKIGDDVQWKREGKAVVVTCGSLSVGYSTEVPIKMGGGRFVGFVGAKVISPLWRMELYALTKTPRTSLPRPICAAETRRQIEMQVLRCGDGVHSTDLDVIGPAVKTIVECVARATTAMPTDVAPEVPLVWKNVRIAMDDATTAVYRTQPIMSRLVSVVRHVRQPVRYLWATLGSMGPRQQLAVAPIPLDGGRMLTCDWPVLPHNVHGRAYEPPAITGQSLCLGLGDETQLDAESHII